MVELLESMMAQQAVMVLMEIQFAEPVVVAAAQLVLPVLVVVEATVGLVVAAVAAVALGVQEVLVVMAGLVTLLWFPFTEDLTWV
jgi:hypothetical protein